jgi:large subunit ribosomal protein L10
MLTKENKHKVVAELKEKFGKSKGVYFTDFTGLTVGDITKLRREFREKGSEFEVAKNTLIRKAIQDSVFSELDQFLTGPTGLGFGYSDPFAVAKILNDYYKRIEKPKVKAFWLEGKTYKFENLAAIALLPPKEVLLQQILGSLNSPISNLVFTLQGVLRNLVGTVEALKEKKENS